MAFKIIVVLILFMGLLRKRKLEPTAVIYSLSYEQIFHNTSPKKLIQFFEEDRFSSRADFSIPIIEIRSLKILFARSPEITYDVVIYILTSVLKKKQYLSIYKQVKEELIRLDKNLSFSLRDLKREILDKCVISNFLLFNNKKTVFITTQSSLSRVPMMFEMARENQKIMIWYSTNSKPVYAKNDLVRANIDFKAVKANIDQHWVWDSEEVRFLESQGIQNVFALGAMIFQEKTLVSRSASEFIVTYFDVTPFNAGNNLYSERNTIAILENLLSLTESMEELFPGKFQLRIKPKRRL
jgi:hypothetical protein